MRRRQDGRARNSASYRMACPCGWLREMLRYLAQTGSIELQTLFNVEHLSIFFLPVKPR